MSQQSQRIRVSVSIAVALIGLTMVSTAAWIIGSEVGLLITGVIVTVVGAIAMGINADG